LTRRMLAAGKTACREGGEKRFGKKRQPGAAGVAVGTASVPVGQVVAPTVEQTAKVEEKLRTKVEDLPSQKDLHMAVGADTVVNQSHKQVISVVPLFYHVDRRFTPTCVGNT
jgi:hypothetical protein